MHIFSKFTAFVVLIFFFFFLMYFSLLELTYPRKVSVCLVIDPSAYKRAWNVCALCSVVSDSYSPPRAA